MVNSFQILHLTPAHPPAKKLFGW